jgi:hypothetical protein
MTCHWQRGADTRFCSAETRLSANDRSWTSWTCPTWRGGASLCAAQPRYANSDSPLRCVKRLLKISEQIPPILDTDRNAHHSIGYAGVGELLVGET